MPRDPNRVRDPLDRFYTDPQLADAFAGEALKMFGSKHIEYFIEPSYGQGSIVRALVASALRDGTRIGRTVAVELDPTSGMLPPPVDEFKIVNGDWLDVAPLHTGKADLILANPPFAKSVPGAKPGSIKRVAIIQKHVEAMLSCLSDGGLCGVLSVQGFLGKPRDTWLSSVARPFKIQQLSPRPSFSADGKTDLREYILSWWEMFDGSPHAPKTEFEWLRWK